MSHVFIDAVRRRRRHTMVSLDAIEAGQIPDPLVEVEQAAERVEEIHKVWNAVAALPSPYRQAVVLVDLKERSYEQTARRLRCKVGTVKSRLHRGRRLLRRHFVSAESEKAAKEDA